MISLFLVNSQNKHKILKNKTQIEQIKFTVFQYTYY